MKKRKTTTDRAARFLALARGRKSALIVLQDGPDPDAIGSAMGLKTLLTRLADVKSTMAYGGTIGRAENRALVELLNVKLVEGDTVTLDEHDLIVMVDTQPGAGNNFLPADVTPDAVVDHHPLQEATKRCPFRDVRPRYGATATIITEYLLDRDIKLDRRLATALVYAIKTDTAGLTRHATLPDREAMSYLFPLHAPEVLSSIENEKVPREYFRVMNRAVQAATVFDDVVVSNMGIIDNPDMVAEVADLLLRLQEMRGVLALGVHEHDMILSIRLATSELDAAGIIRQVVGKSGSGGGHATMAAGRIRLNGMSRYAIEKLGEDCADRFVSALGKHRRDEEKMV